MNKHINTENIIKEKFDSREFAFDESAWAEAEAMIEAQNPGGRKKIFWIFSIALLLGLITAGIWFGTTMQPNGTQLAENKPTPAAEETAQSNQSTATVESNASVNAESAQPLAETAATPTTADNKEVAAANTTNALNNAATPAKSSNKANQKPAAEKAKSAVSTSGNVASNTNKSSGTSTTKKSDNSTNNQLANNDTEDKNSTTDSKKNEATPIFTEPFKANNPTSEESGSTPDLADNSSTTDSEEAKVYTEEVGEKSETELAAVDSSENTPEELTTPSTSRKPKAQPPGFNTKNTLSIIGGMGIWDVYSSTLGKSSTNGILGPVIGVGYEAAFNKQFAIGANLLYMSRGALNYRRVFNSVNYDFGYQNTQTIIEATNLHFVNVPIYARYSFTNKHHVIGGLSYAYMIGAFYTEKKVVETSLETFDDGTKKKFAQHPGFNKWDVISFIGYETNLNDKLKLSAQFQFGFNDMTNDDFKTDGEFNNTSEVSNKYDRNLGVQLMLKYDIFKH